MDKGCLEVCEVEVVDSVVTQNVSTVFLQRMFTI